MLISMHIILDYFQDLEPDSHIQTIDQDINTVRLYQPDVALHPFTVYVGTSDAVFQDGSSQVVLIHSDEWIRLQTENVFLIANRLITLIEEYSVWSQEMLKLVSTSSMTQDFLDCSDDIINLPIFLVDSGQRILSMSRKYPYGSIDNRWDEMLDTGAASMDFLSEVHRRITSVHQDNSIHYFDDPVLPHAIYQRNFYVQENLVGQAIMIDLTGHTTIGQVQRFQIMCDNLNLWFQANIQVREYLQLQLLLRKAVSEPDIDYSELIWQLQLLGWRENDRLILLKFDAPYHPYNINEHLSRSINKQFSNIIATPQGFSILAICNLSREKNQTFFNDLKQLLLTSKYYGVYSREFTLSDSFYANYEMVQIASQQCDSEVGILYDSSEYLHYYLLSEMKKNLSTDQLHPLLKELKQYDEAHHSDLYLTLKSYLENERSAIATAKALQIHRNSLSYRLEKLREISDVNLDDPSIRLYLLISYAIDVLD